MSTPVIDTTSAARFIQRMAPECAWLLQHLESEDGYVRFPPLFSRLIANLNIENYPELYENEVAIGMMMLRAFFSPDEIKALEVEVAALSPEDKGKFVEEKMNELDDITHAVTIPKTPREQDRAHEVFKTLTPEDQTQAIQFWQHFMMAFLAGFYQSLSIMVHGEKLTSLVAQAKAGHDKAFAKAVQIDKRILTAIPYFKRRFNQAQTEGHRKFTEEVAAHLLRPPYKGKIRHKALYLAFAFLDQVGLLDTLKHREILDLCNEAGLDSHANRIDDVKNLSKRLAEYRAFQRREMDLSTP